MAWLRWQNGVDFVVLAVALYALLQWARGTRALRVVLAILGLYASARLAWRFDLTITGWLLDIACFLLILMLLFFFQPELRRAFLRLDSLLGLGLRPARESESPHEAISKAAFAMASERVGALIVIARKDALGDLVSGGTSLGAEISPEILQAIFWKTSPIHDGALLVEGGRISRAGVVLPLTQREHVPLQYGTRHRAAMGMAERCDAIVIAVSEERGAVTLMHGQEILPAATASALVALLASLTVPARRSAGSRVRSLFFANIGYKVAAVSIASVIWLMSFLGAGSTIRTMTVPIEFAGVPAGMEISAQSATRLEVQLRGPSWLLASLQMTGVVARFDLHDREQGKSELNVSSANLDLPPGVVVERVRPEVISVGLAKGPS